MKTLLGIDPGQSGGLALRDPSGEVTVMKMPDTYEGIHDLLEEITSADCKLDDLLCALENVGGYRPGNSGPAACKFARHVGHLEMALYSLEIPFIKVAPSPWMRKVLEEVPKDKQKRKNKIKEDMQRKYPAIKVTLWNADALGLMTYLLESGIGEVA